MEFKLWSQLNEQVKSELKPELGLRGWNDLSYDDKEAIWNYLDTFFFVPILKKDYERSHTQYTNRDNMYYPFTDPFSHEKRERIENSIKDMYQSYRVKNYTKNLSKEKTRFNAHQDFFDIFLEEDDDVVLELLSLFCKNLLIDGNLVEEEITQQFDSFSGQINSVFSDFGIDVFLSRTGFIPKQDEKIINEIFVPVLQVLSDEKWREVNKILADAFKCFTIKNPSSFSSSVTHTVSAVQAFLQILVNGKTGSGDIAALIQEGQKNNLIPNDFFTKEIFKNIVAVLMKERQETGDAHPKKEYATEENAKIVINISMIFIQHCLSI